MEKKLPGNFATNVFHYQDLAASLRQAGKPKHPNPEVGHPPRSTKTPPRTIARTKS
jgi:hypothetical protein